MLEILKYIFSEWWIAIGIYFAISSWLGLIANAISSRTQTIIYKNYPNSFANKEQ